MAQPPAPQRGAHRARGRRADASWFDGDQPGGGSASDLAVALFRRTNLLVVGDDDAVERVVTAAWPSLATPIRVRRRGERLRLLPALQSIGTIIVHDVDTLTPQEQRELFEWMEAGDGGTQVVSTASQSLVPMLETGAFSPEAYYRLNVVTLDLTDH